MNVYSLQEDFIYRFHLYSLQQILPLETIKSEMNLENVNGRLYIFGTMYFGTVIKPVLEIYDINIQLALQLKNPGLSIFPKGIVELIMKYNCGDDLYRPYGNVGNMNRSISNACSLVFDNKYSQFTYFGCRYKKYSLEDITLNCGIDPIPEKNKANPMLWLFNQEYFNKQITSSEEKEHIDKVLQKRRDKKA